MIRYQSDNLEWINYKNPGRTVELDGQTNGQMGGWIGEQVLGKVNGWMGWTDGSID